MGFLKISHGSAYFYHGFYNQLFTTEILEYKIPPSDEWSSENWQRKALRRISKY